MALYKSVYYYYYYYEKQTCVLLILIPKMAYIEWSVRPMWL